MRPKYMGALQNFESSG